ncbi:MAG: hypothetical protein K2M95_00050 [Clostridiales bacterium]|nr:hypothetical protein [Clostridiales bacterium]
MRSTTKKIAFALGVLLSLFALFGCAKKNSPDIKPHLIALSDAEETSVRPIDSAANTKGFTHGATLSQQFDELLDMVFVRDNGETYKPDFGLALPRIEQTYNAAIHILDRYIKNDFTPLQRLHAIHDYLAYYVSYDFELLEKENNGVSYEDDEPSFTPEGALVKHKAVCDGITKAFMLMCGIEGIRCIRVTGEYSDGEQAIRHAWNKVCLDGKWYNVDVTMDVWHVMTDKNTRQDILCHGYFLVSDADIRDEVCGRHVQSGEDTIDYDCLYTYPYHANEPLGIGEYKMEITSQEELNAVFSAVKASKREIGKIELKLNFPNYDKSNLALPNAYISQIRAAYRLVKDADFSLNEATGAYPYQRYPDGVFVFLFYK